MSLYTEYKKRKEQEKVVQNVGLPDFGVSESTHALPKDLQPAKVLPPSPNTTPSTPLVRAPGLKISGTGGEVKSLYGEDGKISKEVIETNKEIREKNTREWLKGKLPEPVREAFFGTAVQGDNGLIGWMYEENLKSDEMKYNQYERAFQRSTPDPYRRSELATEIINGTEINELTEEEKRVKRSLVFSRAFWGTLEKLDAIGPVGTFAKAAVSKVAKPVFKAISAASNLDEAQTVLRNIGIEEDVIAKWGDDAVKATTEEEVTTLLKNVVDDQKVKTGIEESVLKTVDATDPITVSGKAFSDEVSTFKSDIREAAGEAGVVIKKADNTVAAYRRVVDQIEQAGVKVEGLVKTLDNIEATIRTEPGRFIENIVPKIQEVVRAGEVPKDTTGPVFFADKTEDGINYARGYTIKDIIKTNEPGVIHTAELPEDLKIFDSSKSEDIIALRKVSPEAADALQATPDWQVGTKYLKEVEKAGFDAARLLERPSGSPVFDAVGKQVAAKADIYSTAVFNPKKVKWGKQLDEVADPVKENLGILAVHVQERYGKAAVTKAKARKFAENEKKVFFQIAKFSEEARYVAENGGEMIQRMPEWVPKNLQNVVLFDEVTEILGRGGAPTIHGGPHMELYTAMVDETARLAGIVKKGPKPAVDGSGAIVQSMRENTALPGVPRLREEPGVTKTKPEAVKDKKNVFEDDEPSDFDLEKYVANRGEEVRLAMPKAPRKDIKWMEKVEFKFEGGDVKDVGKFTAYGNDVFAVSERVLKENWALIKEKVFDPFDAAKGRYARESIDLNEELTNVIVKKLGITRKSKASAAVQDFGEGLKTYDQVVREFGVERANQIKEASEWFRGKYDDMLTTLNAGRPKWSQIPKRDDYFRHFDELSDFGQLKNNFENPSLGNIRDESLTTAARKFSFTKAREGEKTIRDAVGGFANYIPQYTYTKHLNPEISKINAFINAMEKQGGPQGYIDFIKTWNNELAFAYNPIDAGLDWMPGSRQTIEVVNWFNNRAKRNAVLGNFGTALAQAFNWPNLVSEAGPVAVARGMKTFTTDLRKGGEMTWHQSDFLTERFMANSQRGLSVGFWEKTTDKAGWMIASLDEVASVHGWYALREKGIALGVADPVKYADDLTRQMIGGRGIGEVSIMQKAKLFQLVAPFTLEAVKTLQILSKRVREKEGGKIAYYLLATYYMNMGVEKLTGQEVSMNLGGAASDAYDIYNDAESDKAKRIAGRMGGEVTDGIPLGKYVMGGVQWASGMSDDDRKKTFGEGDPLKYGTSPLLWNAISPLFEAGYGKDSEGNDLTDKKRAALIVKSMFKIGTPLGGRQLDKTVGGALHLSEEDPDPAVRPGYPGVAQNLLFGKWSPNISYEKAQEDAMRELHHEIESHLQSGDEEVKKAIKAEIKNMDPKEQAILRKVALEEKAIQKEKDKRDMLPTYRAVGAMVANGYKDKARQVLGELTEEEQKIYREVNKEQKTEAVKIAEGVETDPESIIREVVDYAYAIGTNPIQAFSHIFKGQHIETTVGGGFGGMVTVRRIPEKGNGGSAEIKATLAKEQGVTDLTTVKLEHKLPLTLGGNNRMENLELVTTEVHDSSTWMEGYLGRAVKAEKISYVDAQELIMRFKGYTGEKITKEEILEVVGQSSFSKDEYHKGWDDLGKDTWLLSDQDYAERKDPVTGKKQGKRTLDHRERDQLLEVNK